MSEDKKLPPPVEIIHRFVIKSAQRPEGEALLDEKEPPPAELAKLDVEVETELAAPAAIDYEALGDIAEDTLRIYLSEAGRTPLLTAYDERELSQAYEGGRKAIESMKESLSRCVVDAKTSSAVVNGLKLGQPIIKVIGSDEELAESAAELAPAIRKGELARRRLVEANLRLVVSIARKYVGRGLTLLDLIQEGNIGLMRAIEKFDWRRGFKLSTYATWWIRQAISRAVADQARTIRLPVHLVDTLSQINQAERRLTGQFNRPPTDKEIAEELKIPVEKVEAIRRFAQPPASLDKVVGDEEGSSLSELVPDDRQSSPFALTSGTLLKETVQDVISSLSPRERAVLDLRYGLTDDHPRTLEEVGRELGVTRERIRQIEAHAIRKLRHPSRSKLLRDFLGEAEE